MTTAFVVAYFVSGLVSVIGEGVYIASLFSGPLGRAFGRQRRPAGRIAVAGWAVCFASFIGITMTEPSEGGRVAANPSFAAAAAQMPSQPLIPIAEMALPHSGSLAR